VRLEICAAAAAVLVLVVPTGASADPSAYLGEVRAFAFDYCPRGWLPADGRVLRSMGPENAQLKALLGNTYGGDGFTTFALPDLRGRAPIGAPTDGKPGATTGAAPGGPDRFVNMTWCISVEGDFPRR